MALSSKCKNYPLHAWQDNRIRLKATQGEGGIKIAQFTLLDDSGAINLSSATSVTFDGIKRDGSGCCINCKIVDATKGIIEFVEQTGITDIDGNVNGTINVVSADGNIKFDGITLYVAPNNTTKLIEASQDFTALVEALNKLALITPEGTIALDDTLTDEGVNAVQGKAIKAALDTKSDKATTYTKTEVDTSIDNSTSDLKNVIDPKISTGTITVEPNQEYGYFVEIADTKWLKNAIINIKLSDDNSLINYNVQLQYYSLSENGYIKIATTAVNEIVTYMLPEDTYKIRCYIPPFAVVGSGDISLSIEYIGIINSIANIYNSKSDKETTLELQNAINPKISTATITVEPNREYGYFVEIADTKWLKNAIINIKLSDDNSLINYNVQLQYYSLSENGYIKIATTAVNEIVTYMLPEDTYKIRCYIPPFAVVGSGDISLSVEYIGVLGGIANIYKKVDLIEKISGKISGKTFSVVGDSYSAYKNWIPSDRGYWYTSSMDKQTTDRVDSVTQMWWYILSKQTKMSLLCNDSFTGTTICTTGYHGDDVTQKAMVTRVSETLGIDKATLPKPDFVFIFGGTNDDWANSPIGELKYSDWTTDDLKSVLPAFCYLIDYIKLYNPHATIVNIVNDSMDTKIATGMATACEHYGAVNIELTGISKEEGHPTATGQATIADEIITVLKSM